METLEEQSANLVHAHRPILSTMLSGRGLRRLGIEIFFALSIIIGLSGTLLVPNRDTEPII